MKKEVVSTETEGWGGGLWHLVTVLWFNMFTRKQSDLCQSGLFTRLCIYTHTHGDQWYAPR